MSQFKFTVDLVPSSGFNEIVLGASLYDVLNHLINKKYHLKFAFSSQNLIDVPYTVHIKELDARLVFNGSNQSLQFIEFNKFDNLKLSYKKTPIVDLSMKQIYNNSFGPTYPGEIINGFYILSYPGISFRVKIPSNITDNIFIKLLEIDARIDTIVIHHEQNWRSVCSKTITLKEDAYILMDNKEIHIHKDPHKIIIDRVDIDLVRGKFMIRFLNHPDMIKNYELGIGITNQQDILAILGPPDDIFHKNDSRLTIHSDGVFNPNEVFHNYFNFGIDILYDISSSKGSLVKKIIIHNNLPNSLNFQKYKKCVWRMVGYDNEDEDEHLDQSDWKWINDKSLLATSEMYFSEIPANFKKNGSKDPIILNRYDLINSLDQSIEIISCDDETGQDGPNGKIGNYGNSMIFAHERCIWEVCDDAVNSITLY